MRCFRVLHNFDAQDTVELTVKKGEVVVAVENDVQEGWIKVEVLNDGQRRGFVPLNYLRETAQPLDESGGPPQPNLAAAPGPATASVPRQPSAIPRESPSSFTSAALDYGDTLKNMYASATREPSVASRRSRSAEHGHWRAGAPTPATAVTVAEQQQQQQAQSSVDAASSRSLLNDPNAVVEAFMKNELHFKQLVRQRQDALAQMRSTLEGAMADVAACKEKNATLARKLRDLDQCVEKERKRWKDRIEEERAYISRSVSHEHPGSVTAGSPPASSRY
ncbi:putative SH3 domain protein [Trypanosoma grayi]|uniref:putative SH3 domain protein n=1 Tax=Trypanosoma grayi TaxID=71804 RepID=UPI0004F46F23|nr:putative SH3 domain protein [Trypanosoma grayi]KEG12895.1 putative SH3 domain protein [Trypanosoma grayi]